MRLLRKDQTQLVVQFTRLFRGTNSHAFARLAISYPASGSHEAKFAFRVIKGLLTLYCRLTPFGNMHVNSD